MPDSQDVRSAQDEYMQLAQKLWAGFEPILAQPMKDRDLFEFLGFD
jgi:light-independent protochlorophyllide reductase subunit L